jgi:lycopene beta-cyclase
MGLQQAPDITTHPREPGLSRDPTTLLLAGGGLANGLIAYRLAQTRPEVRFKLVEGGARLGGRHTWSFFGSDLGSDGAWIAPFLTCSWSQYEVRFPRRQRKIINSYKSITSDRFHDVLMDRLGDRVLTCTPISALEDDGAIFVDGSRLSAEAVIDGRGPGAMPELVIGYQKFFGQKVRLASDHGLKGPVIMDATVDQKNGYRFIYVLPWSERTLLIEDTRYTDGDELDLEDMRRGIGEYAEAQGWTTLEVLDEEQGILPIALDGDIEGHWAHAAGRTLAGLRAVLFHPTTGYSLPDAVGLANAICELPVIDAVALERLVRERSIRLWRERAFFRLVNRMLFRAGRPGQRYRVLERFYGLPEPLIKRFYAASLTRLDKLRILTGKPPVPFGAALKCIGEQGHA